MDTQTHTDTRQTHTDRKECAHSTNKLTVPLTTSTVVQHLKHLHRSQYNAYRERESSINAQHTHTHSEIMSREGRGVHILEEGEEVEGVKESLPSLSTKDNVSAQVQTCR